jgi:2-oxoglutarate dehydrogenase E1 component
MGAWRSVRHRLEDVLPPGVELRYEGRPSQAAPSEGYPKAHQEEQTRIVTAALGLGAEDEAPEAVLESAVEVD